MSSNVDKVFKFVCVCACVCVLRCLLRFNLQNMIYNLILTIELIMQLPTIQNYIWSMFDIILLARCSPVPYLDHAMVDGSYTSLINSSVNLRCHPGHRFSNGDTEKQIVCLANREWEEVDDCIGEPRF